MAIQNFGQNLTLRPAVHCVPANEEEVLQILSKYRDRRFRAVGRLHSWSQVLAADDVLLDLRRLNRVDAVQAGDRPTVRVGAGCQIKRLLRQLHRQGDWTLPSLGFVTEQTVAGAVSTGTHGSGKYSLSRYVRRVRVAHFQGGNGQAVISEIDSGEELAAARCSLGTMGIIVSVDFEVRRKYHVEEHFREFGEVHEVLAAEREFPLQQFYLAPWRWTYFVQHRREVDRRKSWLVWLYRAYRFLVIDVLMHWAIFASKWRWRLVPGTKFLFRKMVPLFVIKHWRVTDTSSRQLVMEHELFRHVEIELFVKRRDLPAVLRLVRDLVEIAGDDHASLAGIESTWRLSNVCLKGLENVRGQYVHHFPICVRRIMPDETLISMTSYLEDPREEDWYSISFCCYDRHERHQGFPQFAQVLARTMSERFNVRIHWGKLCPLDPKELCQPYPRFGVFREIVHRFDPHGRFRNDWVEALLEDRDAAQDLARDQEAFD